MAPPVSNCFRKPVKLPPKNLPNSEGIHDSVSYYYTNLHMISHIIMSRMLKPKSTGKSQIKSKHKLFTFILIIN